MNVRSIASKYFNANHPSYYEFVTCHCPNCHQETFQGHKRQEYPPVMQKLNIMADCFECGHTYVIRTFRNGVEVAVKG